MGTVEERLDMLTADCLAYEQVLGAMVVRLGGDERAAMLAECREIIDALGAHPEATDRGHDVFQQTELALGRIFREPRAQGEAPLPDR